MRFGVEFARFEVDVVPTLFMRVEWKLFRLIVVIVVDVAGHSDDESCEYTSRYEVSMYPFSAGKDGERVRAGSVDEKVRKTGTLGIGGIRMGERATGTNGLCAFCCTMVVQRRTKKGKKQCLVLECLVIMPCSDPLERIKTKN